MIKIFGVGDDESREGIDDEILSGEKEDNDVGQIAVDILEDDLELVILAPVAGIALEDIDLSFNNSILTISGFRQKPEIYENDVLVKVSECYWGKFVRNIILPENLDFDNIKATMENNLLIVSIKKLYFEPKGIKINKLEN